MSEQIRVERLGGGGVLRVSVIVPSLRGAIGPLRASLAGQSLQEFELIVVAGVSPAALARNLGVARAHGEIVVFVDDDTTFGHPRVLEQLVSALDADPSVGVVGPAKQLSPGASRRQRLIAAQVPRWVSPVYDRDTESNPPLDGYGFSEITTTCCAVRRAEFERLGGFDERLITGEDPEFFFRARRAGHGFLVPAGCWVCHDPPASLRDFARKCYRYGIGHAQEAHKNRERGMDVVPATGLIGTLLLLFSPLLWPVLLFCQPYLEPRRHLRLHFQPYKALSTLATYYGYAFEARRLQREAPGEGPLLQARSTRSQRKGL
jgi:GT2 family glycosyltransferase